VNLLSIVGFGLVGRAIAARLFAAGHRVPGDDIAPGACAFVALGILVLADAAQTSRSIRTC
jgi:3-hydroxyisobutyrate dehydrogenase-like beta-hydroxyacid dehydrogenase